jgi:hypothetical protein
LNWAKKQQRPDSFSHCKIKFRLNYWLHLQSLNDRQSLELRITG